MRKRISRVETGHCRGEVGYHREWGFRIRGSVPQSGRRLGGREWIFETDGKQWNRSLQEEVPWVGSKHGSGRDGMEFLEQGLGFGSAPTPAPGPGWVFGPKARILGRELEKEKNGGGFQNKEGVSPTNRVLEGNM